MNKALLTSRLRLLGAAVALLCLCACASTRDPRDPLEGVNRAVFQFNEGVDSYVLKPAAKGYEAVVPDPVQAGVSNFFGNIADLWIGVNNLLQGKPQDAVTDAARVAFNSTFGIFGLIDIATPMGLEKHDEDFGQTLGRWGIDEGAYLVLPIVGPRNVRDAVGFAADFTVDPVSNYHEVATRNTAYALRLVDTRVALLPADKVIEEAALDKYAYIRDAYLQRRRNLVFDGRPPREDVSE